MKIGIFSGAYSTPNGIDYAACRKHGYECMDYQQLCNTKGAFYSMSDTEFKTALTEERKKANDAGIEFSQVHAPWPVDDSTEQSRAKKLENMKTAIRGTHFLDGKYLVVHPTRMWEADGSRENDGVIDENIRFFGELAKYGAEFGVGICIENMPFIRDTLSSPQSIADFVRDANIPNLSICLDTGHAWLYQVGPADAVRIMGDKLTTLHVHDNDGKSDYHWVPGEGRMKWGGFGKALEDVGYKGVFSLEGGVTRRMPADLHEYFASNLCNVARYIIEHEEIITLRQ